jgi:hypothetical protein
MSPYFIEAPMACENLCEGGTSAGSGALSTAGYFSSEKRAPSNSAFVAAQEALWKTRRSSSAANALAEKAKKPLYFLAVFMMTPFTVIPEFPVHFDYDSINAAAAAWFVPEGLTYWTV